jgi:hypothetical protein
MTDFLRHSTSRRRIRVAFVLILSVLGTALLGFALRGVIGL